MKRKSEQRQNQHSSKTTHEEGMFSSLYEPEPTKPEWLALPPELEQVDFSVDGAAAWNKYAPYNPQHQLPISPLNEPPIFVDSDALSPALCFQVNAVDGRARAATLHFPNCGPPVTTVHVTVDGSLHILPVQVNNRFFSL